MSLNFRVQTYDLTSKSSRLLSTALGNPLRIRPSGSEYHYEPNDRIVNYGLYGSRGYPIAVNKPEGVINSTSKLRSFKCFNSARVKTVEWTTSYDTAKRWQREGAIVYARDSESGDHGAGIHVIHQGESLPYTSFYTKGFPTYREFRVYVGFGKIFGIREKVDNTGGTMDPEVRASDTWEYKRNVGRINPEVYIESIKACRAVGLDYVGVDIAVDREDNVCVFEVNSAPWLSPMLAEALAELIVKNVT